MIQKQQEKSKSYPCSLCSYFRPNRNSWGSCELFNVEVNGNDPCCKVSNPFFKSPQFCTIKRYDP